MQLNKINEARQLLYDYKLVCGQIEFIEKSTAVKVRFCHEEYQSIVIADLPGVQNGIFGVDGREPLSDVIKDRILADLYQKKTSLECKIQGL